jgi:hypothetical protein
LSEWDAFPLADQAGGWDAFPLAPAVGTAEDIAKTALPSVGRMVSETVGAPGDIGSLMSAAGDKLGIPQGAKSAIRMAASGFPGLGALATGPTSQQAQSVVSPITGDYEPKTIGGKVFDTSVRFAPAVIGGPETLAAKVGTRVLAPAAAAEAAGALAEGTAAEPYAKAGGAIAGGLLAHRLTAPAAQAALESGPIKSAATTTYQDLRSGHVAQPIAQAELDNLAADLTKTVNKIGPRPSVAPQGHKAIEEIKIPATAGQADVADLVSARQSLKGFFENPLPDPNKAVAAIALPKIDAAIERLSPGTMTKLREADKNYSAASTMERLDKRIARAELRAAGAHSGMNLGNKLRQNAATMLLSGKESRGLLAPEIAALNAINKGTIGQNLLRFGSNALGGGGGLGSTLLGLGAGGAGYATGHPEAAALPFLGLGLRGLYNRSIARQVADVSRMIGNRSPLGQARAAAYGPPPARISPQEMGLLGAIYSTPAARGLLPFPEPVR